MHDAEQRCHNEHSGRSSSRELERKNYNSKERSDKVLHRSLNMKRNSHNISAVPSKTQDVGLKGCSDQTICTWTDIPNKPLGVRAIFIYSTQTHCKLLQGNRIRRLQRNVLWLGAGGKDTACCFYMYWSTKCTKTSRNAKQVKYVSKSKVPYHVNCFL